ncbi:hypothetical protein PENTCL1PPCAC_21061, partial [Pristionchus entomophagus]
FEGLRAWAVISVVIFHFFSSLLPFGYLGVDVFFVLSGFLISLVLKNKSIEMPTYTNFYFKRIREQSALHAALFITNLKGDNEGENYFRDLENADDLYTHTWSLSVEIQFYLLAPLLLHMLKPSCSESFHTLGYFLALAGFSLLYSRSLPSSSAFYSTLARLWQFTSGAIAFQL